MIALTNVHARGAARQGRPPSQLKGITLAREGGVLAIVGAPVDGTSLLLSVIAGEVRAKRGVVLVSGKAPDDARALIAHVPQDAALPEALRVAEICELAATLRGEPPRSAKERLAPLGLEALAERRVRSLSRGEVRAISLALALTSRASVLLVDEPLALLEPTAPGQVTELIQARKAGGATIIVTTSSVRDATRLGDALAVLTLGVLAPLPASLAHVGKDGARLRVVVPGPSGATTLGAELAEEPGVSVVETNAFASEGASSVVVAGADLLAVARAVGTAAARAHVDVEAIESAVVPLDAIRATLTAPRVVAASQPPPPAASVPPPSLPPAGAPS